MVTTVKNYKKDPKTGKNVATGTSKVIGNVAQQTSNPNVGGYTKGAVATVNSQGQVMTQLPQNNSIPSLSGQVYGAVQENIPQNTAPNPSALPSPAQPLPAADGSLSSSPAPMQGEQSSEPRATQQQALQTKTVVDKNGVATTYQNYDSTKSFISQTGSYEFPFWTKEGQAERVKNLFEVSGFAKTGIQFSGGEQDPTSLPGARATVNVLNAASIVYGGASLYKSMAQMGKVGSLALGPSGAETLAANVAPTTTQVLAAGKPAVNPATTAHTINFIKTALASKDPVVVGSIILSGLGAVAGSFKIAGSTLQNAATVEGMQTSYAKASGELQNKYLQEAEKTTDPIIKEFLLQQAKELSEKNKDIVSGYDQIRPFIPFLAGFSESQIHKATAELNEYNVKYDNFISRKIEEEKAVAEEAAVAEEIATQQADAQKVIDNRNFQQQQQDDQQEFQRSEREARQAFEERQNAIAAGQKQFDEDTQITSSEGGTLTFGLLGGGGATEFVSADRAAQAYFGKVYEELSPEQKRLLNLLKGGN